MNLADLFQPVDGAQFTASRWAVQIKVLLCSSIRLRVSPVCESTSIEPESLVAAVDLLVREMPPVLVPAQAAAISKSIRSTLGFDCFWPRRRTG